jgi:phenylacetate-coenzyme A ligase PaaK-like adenylate-forming protein
VFNQYGATEGGVFAMECASHRGLHIFEDQVILEVVDRNNRPLPPGTYGDKVLLTVLFNYSQPLIRYELSDRVQVDPTPCPCGCAFKLLSGIHGRQEEVLRFPAGAGGTVSVHPMVFYRILDATAASGWQVIQESDRLCLNISGSPDSVNEHDVIDTVRIALERQGAVVPPIVVQWQEDVVRGVTGKAARIESRLSSTSDL